MGVKKKEIKNKKIVVGIYPEEIETVTEKIKEKIKLQGDVLNSRDIRAYFELKPTHRGKGIKGQIMEEIKELDEEKQKQILADIKFGREEI